MTTTSLATANSSGYGFLEIAVNGGFPWLRGQDLNLRPSGYEPSGLNALASGKSGIPLLPVWILANLITLPDINCNTKTTTDSVCLFFRQILRGRGVLRKGREADYRLQGGELC